MISSWVATMERDCYSICRQKKLANMYKYKRSSRLVSDEWWIDVMSW